MRSDMNWDDPLVVALEHILNEAAERNPAHVGKVDQLRSAIATCQMLVDQLSHEVPYVPSSL